MSCTVVSIVCRESAKLDVKKAEEQLQKAKRIEVRAGAEQVKQKLAQQAIEAMQEGGIKLSPNKRGSTNKKMLEGLQKAQAAARAFQNGLKAAAEVSPESEKEATTKSRFPDIFASAEAKKKLVFRTSNR